MFTCRLDVGDFRRRVAQTQQRVNLTLRGAVGLAADAGVEQAKRGRFKDRTGKLRKEIHRSSVLKGTRDAYAYIVSATPYARCVEYGTTAHEIWPRSWGKASHSGQKRRTRDDIGTNRVALRIPVGGGFIFRAMVHHPGSAAYPFMGPAGQYAEVVLREQLIRGFYSIQAIWE